MTKEYARVYLLDTPFCIDKPYDYFIPVDMRRSVKAGSFVSVPFGNGNRQKLALVFELTDKIDAKQTKPLLATVSSDIALDEKMLRLALFIKEQTLCTVGDAIHAMIPSAALSKLIEYYTPASVQPENKLASLSQQALFVLDYINGRGSASLDSLKNRFGGKVSVAVSDLLSAKLIEKELVLRDGDEDRAETVYSLSPAVMPIASQLAGGEKIGKLKLTSAKQRALLTVLLDGEARSRSEITDGMGEEQAGASITPQLNSLCEKGLIIKGTRKISSTGHTVPQKEIKEIALNKQQTEAYETLSEFVDSGQPKAALLFGVTGSGKTSVVLKTIDRVLQKGRGAIILLPEIALTPQSIEIFRSRYGDRVSIIHSGLTPKERCDAYMNIRSGASDVVLGTRSAVFAPVKDLGLIVIDEEQEHTYKSDMNPKYHARDIARMRCADNNALMLLASATPSLESYQKALDGKYTLIRLTERYGNAKLPSVIISDMRKEAAGGNLTPLGNLLTSRLIENQKNGNQSVLFINRRGYNNFVSCRLCGTTVTCPHCSVAMTYHTKKDDYSAGELVCHWCGTRKPLPKKCPECGGEHLVRMGYGTQRIEEELGSILDGTGARILRMDTDTTQSKFSYDKMLGSFRRRESDVLLGTQMVTKGHDFPGVTLVGVLLADASLYLDDYRASERTFALLTQVIGRAGRGDKPGTAVIQTNNPDNDVIRLACAQDYETFAQRELKLRKLLVFPPYCDIVLMTLSGVNENELMMSVRELAETFKKLTETEYSDIPFVSFGPFEAPVYRVEGRYRMRMVLKCRLTKRSRQLFATILSNFAKRPLHGKLTLSIDFNPSNL